MAKPRQLTPSCFGGGTISFSLLPDPQVKKKQVKEVLPVYLDATGAHTTEVTNSPFMIQKRDANGNRLWSVGDGTESIHPSSPDGSIQYDPVMVQQTTEKLVQVDDTWEDGSPRITFGTMSYNPPILCKQTDESGNRVRYPGDPANPISFTDADLTKQEVEALQALFAGFMARVSAEHSLYPSPQTAADAGA